MTSYLFKNSEEQEAYEYLKAFRGQKIYAQIASVARSGASRRIKFFVTDEESILNITARIARLLGSKEKYPAEGMRIKGCGMDMIFHTLTRINYAMAAIENIELSGAGGVENSYSNYFFDADRYQTI